MATNKPRTFIVDCPVCRAKVAANESGRAYYSIQEEFSPCPYVELVVVGNCPSCDTILVGESKQIGFDGINSQEDVWSDIVRVYPQPMKTFSSRRIPRVVIDSLDEADRSFQAGANIAACSMLGRALEALCRDVLNSGSSAGGEGSDQPKKKLMLGEGIQKLRDNRVIDDRLYDWSQQLHAFRNLAAHPEDISISREDVEDLQTFVITIVEYVYDLADRYEDFKRRTEARAKRQAT